MKAKLNDAQARAYIAGEQSEPVQEIERKHILHLAACLREAADRPGMNLPAAKVFPDYKTARAALKARSNTK